MKLKDFIEEFANGTCAIFIETSARFKAICDELEARGFMVFKHSSFNGTLYEYAIDREKNFDFTCLTLYRRTKDSKIEVTAASNYWIPKTISANEIETPAEAELLALLGGAA